MANKRNIDTWKKKKWFDIIADDSFDGKEIGKTIAIEGKELIGRTIKKGLDELTNNIRDSSHYIIFKINKVTATKAESDIFSFDTKHGFLRRIIRRQKSKIESVFYVSSKDHHKLKLKVLFISGTKYPTALRAQARKTMVDYFTNEAKEKTIKELWSDLIFQKLSENAKKQLAKLGFVNKVVVTKAKLVE
jgi:small subunit ribosomal protein S3Ae